MSNLTLYRPFRGLSLFDSDSDNWLNDFWNRSYAPAFNPNVEVTERENEFLLSVEAPGMKKDEVHVEVKEGVLRLWGEKKAERKEKKDNCTYSERSYGSFERSFRLPEHVKEGEISAHYENGILELTIPKAEVVKPKAIEIKVK